MYGAAAAYGVAILSGLWWKTDTIHVVASSRLGVEFHQVVATPTTIAISGYVVLIVAGALTLSQLYVSYRSGKHEARGAVLGHAFIVGCALNDVLSAAGVTEMPVVMPYGFLIYGFGVADTIWKRRRRSSVKPRTLSRTRTSS
jgi:hypothetical protein